MTRFVVEAMPRGEISDPQGMAITTALHSIGFDDIISVRQGKRFEFDIEIPEHTPVEGVLPWARVVAEQLLVNTVIEDYTVRMETE